jgi:hypothetical protein
MEQNPSKLTPALIGGGAMAVLSVFPILNMANCFCCFWVVGGGLLAAFLYSRSLPPGKSLTASDGAVVGALAGVFGALFTTCLSYLGLALFGINPGEWFFRQLLDARPDISEDMGDWLREFEDTGTVHPAFLFIGLLISAIANTIFATLGGLLGAAIFKKPAKPATPANPAKSTKPATPAKSTVKEPSRPKTVRPTSRRKKS